MVMKGVIKNSIIWIHKIAPIVIIIGRSHKILGNLVVESESVLSLAAVALKIIK